VQGLARLRVVEMVKQMPYLQARVEYMPDRPGDAVDADAAAIELRKVTRQVIELMPELPAASTELVESVAHPGHLADLIAANVDVPIEQKQSVLEAEDLPRRMRMVLEIVSLKREILLRGTPAP
jgi:ATP-dependent Lon protease